MKRVFVLTLGVLLIAAFNVAKADPYGYAMSGEMLVRQFEGPPELASSGARPSDEVYQAREVARGYLNGVKDSTQGAAWCYYGKFKPDELDSELVGTIKKLPPEKLRGVAAPLVIDALRARFPCPARSKP